MEALRLTFRLATAMVDPGHPVHLDAVLAFAAVQAAGGDLAAAERLPLERHEPQAAPWCWKASRIVPHVVLRDVLPVTRAFEPWAWAEDRDVRYAGGPRVLTGGTGPYKSYQLRFGMIQADVAIAYALGERAGIEALLAGIHHLGKLARLGCGEIVSVRVEPDEAARECWAYRTLPDQRPGYRAALATVRPPYWRRGDRTRAWEPAEPPAELMRALQ